MSKINSNSRIEVWTVDELVDATSENPSYGRQVTIPEFQRSLVWKPRDDRKLITSIKRRYPIGSILVFRDTGTGDGRASNLSYYKLIDGLQRTQAIRRYMREVNSDFDSKQLPDGLVEYISTTFDNLCETDYSMKELSAEVREAIIEWVRGNDNFENASGGTNSLTNALISRITSSSSSNNTAYRLFTDAAFQDRLAGFLDGIRQEADISKEQIPVIVYSGPSSELATVFELLNTQGTPLNEFDILAAKWLDYRHQIANAEIIDTIWKRYELLEDQGYILDVFNQGVSEKIRKQRYYTLFEYLFGLGHFLAERFPRLFKSVWYANPNRISFNLVAACLGLHNRNRADIPEILNKTESFCLSRLENCLIASTEFVDAILEPVTSGWRVKDNTHYGQEIHHSEQQIISFVASAFRARYNSDDFSEKEGWESASKQLENNIPMFYLFDNLHQTWSSGVHDTMYSAVSNHRYFQPAPSKQQWEDIFNSWFNNVEYLLRHRVNVKPSSRQILFLRYLYAHKLSWWTDQMFHVEHVIPIRKLQSQVYSSSRYNPAHGFEEITEKGPINTISNLALLDPSTNIEKRDLDFVEFLKKQLENNEITAQEYCTKLIDFELRLICPSDLIPETLTKESYEDFLFSRFSRLKAEFYYRWSDHIPQDPNPAT